MKYARGHNPNSHKKGLFPKGHKLNVGNQYAKGKKHTDEWKAEARERMKGNTRGFKKGQPVWNKGTKGVMTAWNKGKKWTENSGENHWHWIEDRTNVKLDKERGGPLHKQWSRAVKSRDGWQCKISTLDCSGRIESHHILSWKDHPELRYEINNGITLCHFHHPRKKEDEEALAPSFFQLIDLNISHLNK